MSYQSKRDGYSKSPSLKGKIIYLRTWAFCLECNCMTKTKVYIDHDGKGMHLKVCDQCEVDR